MVLLDRIARDPSVPQELMFVGHKFEAALWIYFHGQLSRTEMLTLFGITAAEEADFDQFKGRYDSLLDEPRWDVHPLPADLKHEYVEDVLSCVVGIQQGWISKDQFNTYTGLNLSTS